MLFDRLASFSVVDLLLLATLAGSELGSLVLGHLARPLLFIAKSVLLQM